MKKVLLIAALLVALLLATTACVPEDADQPIETTAKAEETTAAEAPTEAQTAAPTEALTEEPTEVPTDPADPSEETTEEVTEEKKLPEGLTVVGKSYDGKYDCYDGNYIFEYEICAAEDGTEFRSVQECIDYLATLGGGRMSITDHLDICLSLNIPEDGNSYIIYYNFMNCDFVFNYGVIYDDTVVGDEIFDIPGFAYYSSLEALDAIDGLGNTSVWVVSDYEALEIGRNFMTVEQGDDSNLVYNYHYEKIADMTDWYGLIDGEYLPEE